MKEHLNKLSAFRGEFEPIFRYLCSTFDNCYGEYKVVIIDSDDEVSLEIFGNKDKKNQKPTIKLDITCDVEYFTPGAGRITAERVFFELFLRSEGFYKDGFRVNTTKYDGEHCLELGVGNYGAKYAYETFRALSKMKDIVISVSFGHGSQRNYLYFTKTIDVIRAFKEKGVESRKEEVSRLEKFKEELMTAVRNIFSDAKLELPSGCLKFSQTSEAKGKIVAQDKDKRKQCAYPLREGEEDVNIVAGCFVVNYMLYHCDLCDMFFPTCRGRDKSLNFGLKLVTNNEELKEFWKNILQNECTIDHTWCKELCFYGWKNAGDLCKAITEKIHPISALAD